MKATAIRKGTVIIYQGAPYRVMEFTHITPGKGRALVKVKLRNLLLGNQTEVSFASSEDVEEANVFSYKATYLYKDQDGYCFMNKETYEQVHLDDETLGDAVYYLQDEMEVDITTYENKPIAVKVPSSVVLTVVETQPEIKGATATNVYKPAITDTGLSISIPPFIKEGEKIIVNTDTKEYVSRA
ncbi:MAG: elongation factor P [Bdellovibrionota bacterium]